MKGQEDITTGI